MPRPAPLSSRDAVLRRFLVLRIVLWFGLVSALAPAPRIACAAGHDDGHVFQRIATFPVFLNTDEGTQTGAEIVSASEDGKLLIYTDSQPERLGFVDIDLPGAPKPQGVLAMSGEPTSVAVSGPYALAVVDTSPSFSAPSGELVVVNLTTRDIERRIDLGGQPDSIAVSPDRHYAAITIENERDEEAGDGRPPQSPPGFVVIVDLQGPLADWGTRKVDLVGIPGCSRTIRSPSSWTSTIGTSRPSRCRRTIMWS